MEIFQECVSSVGWQEIEVPSSNPENPPYLVTIPPWDRGDISEVACTCKGFLNRGWCRHQREAYSLVCNWSELDSDLKQTDEQWLGKICPECKGGTHIVVMIEEGE